MTGLQNEALAATTPHKIVACHKAQFRLDCFDGELHYGSYFGRQYAKCARTAKWHGLRQEQGGILLFLVRSMPLLHATNILVEVVSFPVAVLALCSGHEFIQRQVP